VEQINAATSAKLQIVDCLLNIAVALGDKWKLIRRLIESIIAFEDLKNTSNSVAPSIPFSNTTSSK